MGYAAGMANQIDLVVDGEPVTVDVDGNTPVLTVLRETLGRTELKFGCRGGFCGTCALRVDGQRMLVCVTPVESVAGKSIVTTKD